jgi:two-component system sensor histidine kinase KdpD
MTTHERRCVFGDKMSPAERIELLSSIEDETARLARFVANLLDMSRIEAGGLKVNRDLVAIADVVQGAVERSRKAFPGQPVRVSLAPNLPFVRGDDKLLEQVLFNLLYNAHRYAGDAGATVHARQEGGEVVLTVTDEGPGIKPGEPNASSRSSIAAGAPTDGRRAPALACRSRGAWSKRWGARSWRRVRRCVGAELESSCAFPPSRRRR